MNMRSSKWVGLVLTMALLTACDSGTELTPDTGTGTADAGTGTTDDSGNNTCAPTACESASVQCDGNALVTCTEDSDGCLIENREDCAATAGGTCDSSGATPMCVVDPCATVANPCTTAGMTCSADTLVVCAADSNGCLVENRMDCTAMAGGFCNPETNACDADMCRTLPNYCAMAGDRCDSDNLVVCAPDDMGCLVETTTDCTTTSGERCREVEGTNTCVDPCTLVTTCSAAESCDGADRVSCAADADGCLVESSRTACAANETCTDTDGATSCTAVCAAADTTELSCASGTVTLSTADGTDASDGWCSRFSSGYTGRERIFRFADSMPADVTATVTWTSSEDLDLFAVDAGDGRLECDNTSSCLDRSTGTANTETVEFSAVPGGVVYVVADRWRGTATDAVSFDLTISCTRPVCGDGALGAGEACDDMNTVDGDGCSATCAIESDYLCSGTPSVCELACGNGVIDTDRGEVCDDMNAIDGDGCSATCTIEADYACYGEPSVCALACGNGRLEADLGEACDDANAADGDGCSSMCTVEMDYACYGVPSVCALACGNSRLETDLGETCDDGNNTVGDGCSATCVTETGYACIDAPSVCEMATCGNSTIELGESCDDGGMMGGDGCSAACHLETAAAGSSIMISGSIDTSDTTFARPLASCYVLSTRSSNYLYDAHWITNATATTQTLTITANWSADGYLFAYRTPFVPTSALGAVSPGCIAGDDDYTGAGDSQLTNITLEAGQSIVVVGTTYYSNRAIGSYTIEVATDAPPPASI